MPPYRYSEASLDPDSTRLLRLMPCEDETAPIQCQLFNYDLQKSSGRPHRYEALSYVWGSSDKRQSLVIDGSEPRDLAITANLHNALSRLRDHSFERVLWADSVCINQEDEPEKKRQIQLMAKIYGQADRVVVYLGEAADNSDQALEDIRAAAENESTTSLISNKSQEAILKLLERPWFRRIWVLQEVALARNILIMCGSTEINGYTFCSGFNNMELPYKDGPALQLIRSMVYLIRGAIFRPKYTVNPTNGLLSLGELIDMYHAREATQRHDKVYALLSMSSDGLDAADLLPDYAVPWKTLLRRLIEFVLSTKVSIEVWDNRETAVIKGKCYIIGYISSVENDSTRYDRQSAKVVFNNAYKSESKLEPPSRWTLQVSAIPVLERDVVCFLQGASNPSIIRPYKTYFALIMVSVTLRQHEKIESAFLERQNFLTSAESFSPDLVLVWDWEASREGFQGRVGYEYAVEIHILAPEYFETSVSDSARFDDVTMALKIAEEFEGAKKRLQEMIEAHEREFGKENPRTLSRMDELAMVYKEKEELTEAENLLLQVIETRKRVQGTEHPDTLSSIANLASTYLDRDIKYPSSTGDPGMAASLTDQIRTNVKITEGNLIRAMEISGKKVVALLLGLKRENIPITEGLVKAAAGLSNGIWIIGLLLDNCGDEIKITEKIVAAAARNPDRYLMELLLRRRGNEVKITEEVVIAAAENKSPEMIERLLIRFGSDIKITEEILKAAARNPVESVMRELLNRRGNEVKITEEVVIAAAENKSVDIMERLLARFGDEIKITEEILKAAARNPVIYIMAELLNKRRNEVKITEEVVIAAAESKQRYMMELLLKRFGDEIRITERVVVAAVTVEEGATCHVLEMLIDYDSNRIEITEEVVKAAAGNVGTSSMFLLLDRLGYKTHLSEAVVRVAAENPRMIKLLREHRGDEVMLYEDAAKQW
ncbi:HET-domain-containing protein [Hyaloscypha bicolor E]|uniref:HET-domain-containing protein n=1 Tax=Hyaloscypha bicolor E TaxID=1095630 RepID=A0A2J6TXG2_9HELO|nr:HET-domain-containing protein [Hyaloscypha bicolor E]PMD67720.1 HET-domain-containing protein [Hyaloscypha bicolor E]